MSYFNLKNFKGIFDRSQITSVIKNGVLDNGGCCLLNSGDGSHKFPFVHWLSTINFDGNNYIFDTYGRSLKDLDKLYIKLGLKELNKNYYQFESINGSSCGQINVAVLLTIYSICKGNPKLFISAFIK